MENINAEWVSRQQCNETVAATPIHRYIGSLLPLLEHRQLIAQKLIRCNDDSDAGKTFLELLELSNSQILEILGIPKTK